MDLNLLNALSTEGLETIQKRIAEILEGRLDKRAIPGRTAKFVDRNGTYRKVRIEKLNRTTVSCVELSPESGKKWRVGYSLLEVDPIERNVPIPPKPIPSARPATSDDAW